ncbi:MAG: hypothetical protein OIN89_03175 [Candidatus Methanoperedens sp.]|jgi:hypothetical protein|nr:hypothetical protein [Candidatus Methanoperedens sp.]
MIQPYGLEENIGIHVLISNVFWWLSISLVIVAYKHRKMWNIDRVTWILLFLTFLFFGIRELGHLSNSLIIGSIRHIFGIWSATFMTFTFISLYEILYKRKKSSGIKIHVPLALALIFPVLVFVLYFSGIQETGLKNTLSGLESLAWIFGSIITIFTTYRLGTHAIGGFVNVFMFFQFAAYSALLWKLLGFLGTIGYPAPYYIRESIETLFGLFGLVAIYLLLKMLRGLSHKLSRD